MTIHTFDPDRFNFHEIIRDYLDTENLATLESDVDPDPEGEASIYKQMEQSSAYERLYDHLDGPEGDRFYDTFERFIREVIRPKFDEPILYQETPTHRIHFRNDVGEVYYHKDTDYGHHPVEINFSVPQTRAFDTNTIWIESAPDEGDYAPIEMDVGEFAQFDGASLRHGTKNNSTGQTRVSFDFRVIPASQKPQQIVDTSSWEEGAEDDERMQNAHRFARCP
jgi:hypothetical protein